MSYERQTFREHQARNKGDVSCFICHIRAAHSLKAPFYLPLMKMHIYVHTFLTYFKNIQILFHQFRTSSTNASILRTCHKIRPV